MKIKMGGGIVSFDDNCEDKANLNCADAQETQESNRPIFTRDDLRRPPDGRTAHFGRPLCQVGCSTAAAAAAAAAMAQAANGE